MASHSSVNFRLKYVLQSGSIISSPSMEIVDGVTKTRYFLLHSRPAQNLAKNSSGYTKSASNAPKSQSGT